MTDSNRDYETIQNFIHSRLSDLAHAADAEAMESKLQSISIRLQPGSVALIDHMAKLMDYSRQQFLSHLITLALDQAAKSWADTYPDDQAADQYRRLLNIQSSGVFE